MQDTVKVRVKTLQAHPVYKKTIKREMRNVKNMFVKIVAVNQFVFIHILVFMIVIWMGLRRGYVKSVLSV